MRERFRPEIDAGEFVRSATIVVDTNVLLGLYRLSAPSRDESIAVLEKVADRLWLPHQVGVEFYRNVAKVRGELPAAFKKAEQEARSAATRVKDAFGSGTRWRETRDAVAGVVDAAAARLAEELKSLASDDAAVLDPAADQLLERIEHLFEGRLGPEPDARAIQRRVTRFMEWRSPNQVPPGYADDAAKHTDLLRAGDYLLWCEVLSLAASRPLPVLLVTNDTKADWFTTSGAPRHELVAEVAAHGGSGYHQMTFDDFVRTARSVLEAEVAEATVDELVEERRSDAGPSPEMARYMTQLWERQDRLERSPALLAALLQQLSDGTDGLDSKQRKAVLQWVIDSDAHLRPLNLAPSERTTLELLIDDATRPDAGMTRTSLEERCGTESQARG